ncbi:MAG: J domain-containing protein [Candidatus Sulfotelmatobacter sp.]
MSDTYYTALGVLETASPSEIKAAYRNLLKKIHPDTVSTLSPNLQRMAAEATKDIIEAYSVLSDENQRRRYDQRMGWYGQRSSGPTAAIDPASRNQRSRG